MLIKGISSTKGLVSIFIIFTIVSLYLCSCAVEKEFGHKANVDQCPTSVFNERNDEGLDSKLIIILIKETPDFKDNAVEAFNILKTLLPKVLYPGDRVIMLSMEESNLTSSILFDQTVMNVELPVICSTPAIPHFNNGRKLDNTPQTGLMAAVATEDAIEAAEEMSFLATEEMRRYYCELEEWKVNYDSSWSVWDESKEKQIDIFMDDFDSAISLNMKNGFQKSKNQLFEAFDYAYQLTSNECNYYDRCHLLIFSDFYDYRSIPPESIDIDFSNTTISAVLFNYEYYANCKSKMNNFSTIFNQYYSSGIEFSLVNDAEKMLIRQFESKE